MWTQSHMKNILSNHFSLFFMDFSISFLWKYNNKQAWTGSAFNHELVGLMDVTFNRMVFYQKESR